MRYKIEVCDVCGKDITGEDIKYKFKRYENSYANSDCFEFNKWTKLDMCKNCYKKFFEFVNERRTNINDQRRSK